MRTRNAGSSKSTPAKKTPPARKSASKTKTPVTPSNPAGESANPKSPETKGFSTPRTRQAKKNEASPAPNPASDSKLEQSSEETKTLADAAEVSEDTKVAATRKSAVRRTSGRGRTSTKAVSIPKSVEQVEAIADKTPEMDNFEAAEKVDEPQNVEVANVNEIGSEKEGEQDAGFGGQSEEKEQNPMEVDVPVVENVRESAEEEINTEEVQVPASPDASISLKQEGPIAVDLTESQESEDLTGAKEGKKENEELKGVEGEKIKEESKEEERKNIDHGEEYNIESVSAEVKDQLQQEDVEPEKENIGGVEGTHDCGEKLDIGEQGKPPQETEMLEEEPPQETETLEEKPPEETETLEEEPPEETETLEEEPPEETETLEEEHKELAAIANERKIKKEHEIFVGGLDRDATEEDLRKVFEKIGEVVEVRLHKNPSMNRNKGYAFVKFANKEHAKKALSEMKNPVIHGKRCGTAPSEDNDTLFLGNICNSWTKEAIKQKLNDYGIEGVENITLVPDAQHEGLSRGFAFLEFSCHADAMFAYKRLQKPDAIFGHTERTAKVAFAEPLREPDPEIMAHVKSVFMDGLPPHWDENHVREHVKSYGEIVRIVLARNMSTAKRKDFGFIDFSTHEAAVACVDGINNSKLGDGASKTKVRARLSNPLPKTQAVKGGMCGGFRIGHARTGAFPRFGRGSAQGGHPFNWGNFNRNRNFYPGRQSQIGRISSRNDFDFSNTPPNIHPRQFGPQGERRGPFWGGHYAGGQGAGVAGPSTPYLDRAWYGPVRGPGDAIPPRRPFSSDGQFERPFMGRHFDDPHLYDENVHGVKRPFYMTDPDPDYMGPSRLRPRLDYTDPALFHGNHYHDSFGAGSRQSSHDYYGPDYGGGPYSSFLGGNSSYRRGYYY